MSSDVRLVRLGDLLEITSSKRIHMADYVASGVPFYRSKEVIERSKGNRISTELFIAPIQFESIKQKFGIRETYTHLREHSNATFIVLLELCFSALVIFLIELYAGQSGVTKTVGSVDGSERMVSAVLLLIAFWMTPNLFMWSRANQIERDFARRPKMYTSNGVSTTPREAQNPDEPTEAVAPNGNGSVCK